MDPNQPGQPGQQPQAQGPVPTPQPQQQYEAGQPPIAQPGAPAPVPQPYAAPPTNGASGMPPTSSAPMFNGGTPAPAAGAPGPKQKLKLPKWLLLGAPAVIVVVVLAVVFLLPLINGGLKLETYSGDGYSALVPKDYEKTTVSGATAFKENGDEDEETKSAVIVNSEPYGYDLTADQLNDVKEYFKENAESLISSSVSKNGSNELNNFDIKDATVDGHDAFRISADVEKDGKKVGVVTGVVIFGKEDLFMLLVAAHNDDKDLIKSADKIISSIKVD